jgi:8-oxo-dGTP pyrophosphatase MutT (NUDIX family)
VPAVTDARAACLVRHRDELLVEESVDSDEGGRVYRPLGRSVAADQDPEAAVREEFTDTLGVDLEWVTAVGTYDGVQVFEASAAQRWLYGEDGFTVFDPETQETTRLAWLHREDFEKYGETLRPAGLLADL